jgi:hypothetical protein
MFLYLTLALLAVLLFLGGVNWMVMRGVREEERVLEDSADKLIVELSDAIHVLRSYK